MVTLGPKPEADLGSGFRSYRQVRQSPAPLDDKQPPCNAPVLIGASRQHAATIGVLYSCSASNLPYEHAIPAILPAHLSHLPPLLVSPAHLLLFLHACRRSQPSSRCTSKQDGLKTASGRTTLLHSALPSVTSARNTAGAPPSLAHLFVPLLDLLVLLS